MVVPVSSDLVPMEEPRPTAEVTERVVELLRQNVGSGALSLDEFSRLWLPDDDDDGS